MNTIKRAIITALLKNILLITVSLLPTVFALFLGYKALWIFYIIAVIYTAIIFAPIKELILDTNVKFKILNNLSYDISQCEQLIYNQIIEIKDILNYSKSETDVHALNATNEGKVLSYNMSTENGYRARLGHYLYLKDLINKQKDINQ
jgi:hypothetical protein